MRKKNDVLQNVKSMDGLGDAQLDEVVRLIGDHYGLPARCVENDGAATVSLTSPTKRTVAVFALWCDKGRWNIQRATWLEPDFQKDWWAVRQAIKQLHENAAQPSKESSEC